MKKIKSLSLILAFIMAFTVLLAFPQKAEAAVSANVVTKITFTDPSGKYVQNYKYNSKGLLSQMTEKDPSGNVQIKVTYKYNTDYLVKSATLVQFGTAYNVKYTYNANKQLIQRVTTSDSSDAKATTKFTWKNGTLYQSVTTIVGGYSDGEKTTKKYTFNSSGILTKRITTSTYGKTTNTFKYDSNGFLSKMTYADGYTKRTNVYKNNVLTKYRDTSYVDGETYSNNPRSIASDKVSVTKTLSKIIKEQQREIINGNYGTDLYLGYDVAL